ncbi:MAG TPA: DUF3467 domain-containing protein [Polyangiaceae bacterium]|nr:DUF3467 domain-containing protein [Polyangiaceae bacterium]
MTEAIPTTGRLYVNCLEVGFNAVELILRFSQLTASDSEPATQADLITTPAHAKAFLLTLQQSLRDYEARFGEIERMTENGS